MPIASNPPETRPAFFAGQEREDAAAALGRGSPERQTNRIVAVVCLLGVVVTSLGVWTAVRTDRNTEQRLLYTQTRQGAAVLAAAVDAIQEPLVSGLEVQALVLPERRRVTFEQGFSRHVGHGKPFISASLWRVRPSRAQPITTVGEKPGLDPTSATAKSFVRKALTADTSVVELVVVGGRVRIAYALADRGSGSVIYAERAIPANRRAPVDKDSAFNDLQYAIYLGPRTTAADLTTTDVDPAHLPLTGTTSTTSVPFGDTVLTLVTRPRRHLGSDLNQRMPWYVLIAGLLVTLASVTASRQILRSRNRAETDTRTIRALYEKVDTLYGEQHDLAVNLQKALLPRVIPDIPGLEVATEYAAGMKGIDIGGDWYSVIGVRGDFFAFVVGDVSGHGIDAVAEMARARFTVRAYLVDGNPPDIALEKCSRQFDIAVDGHIVTLIAGVGNVRTGEVTVANAGHPRPLLIGEDLNNHFVETIVGPPLGVGATSYAATTFTMPPGSTLLCYTDGLIERRGENIDIGLNRLASTVANFKHSTATRLDVLVTGLVRAMRPGDSADDIAVLALKRVQT